MDKANWSISFQTERKLLRLNLAGFFIPADVGAFAAAVGMQLSRWRATLGSDGHVTICDTRNLLIQSQEAVAAFTDMLAHPVARSRKLAFVVDATLKQMQIRRLTARDDAAFFMTTEDAEAWLFQP